jgi:hypothetical protein
VGGRGLCLEAEKTRSAWVRAFPFPLRGEGQDGRPVHAMLGRDFKAIYDVGKYRHICSNLKRLWLV